MTRCPLELKLKYAKNSPDWRCRLYCYPPGNKEPHTTEIHSPSEVSAQILGGSDILLIFHSATLNVMVNLHCRIWILIPILIQTANQMATLYNSELFIMPPLLERQVNKIVHFFFKEMYKELCCHLQ